MLVRITRLSAWPDTYRVQPGAVASVVAARRNGKRKRPARRATLRRVPTVTQLKPLSSKHRSLDRASPLFRALGRPARQLQTLPVAPMAKRAASTSNRKRQRPEASAGVQPSALGRGTGAGDVSSALELTSLYGRIGRDSFVASLPSFLRCSCIAHVPRPCRGYLCNNRSSGRLSSLQMLIVAGPSVGRAPSSLLRSIDSV